MYVTYMKLEHNKESMAYAYPKVQFACATCVYMANVLEQQNITYSKCNMTTAQMRIFHLIIQYLGISIHHTNQLSSPHIFG